MSRDGVFHYFKGLDSDDRLKGHTVHESARVAMGTLYHGWFETLKTSPWYRRVCEIGGADDESRQEIYDAFGDLRNENFQQWWKKTGYKVFAERVPYTPVKIVEQGLGGEVEKQETSGLKMIIEVPLYLDKATAEQQLWQIMQDARQRYLHVVEQLNSIPRLPRFNRFDYSTAKVRLKNDFSRGITFDDIIQRLEHYRLFEDRRSVASFRLYEFAQEVKVPSHIFHKRFNALEFTRDAAAKTEATKAVYDYLYGTRCLMAYATQGIFPCFNDHPLARLESSLL